MLTLTQTLLLLLPLTTPALAHGGIDHGETRTTSTSVPANPAGTPIPNLNPGGIDNDPDNTNPSPYHRRDISDKFKSLFGDPAAMINSLSDCTATCAGAALEAIKCTPDDGTDCACKNGGKDWAEAAKSHFSKSKPSECKDDDEKLEENALTEICKAVADKPDQKKDADRAVKDQFTTGIKGVVNDIFGGDDSDSDDEDGDGGAKVTVNGKEINAAGGAPSPGAVARAAGGALAAVVGYAVAML